MGKKKCFHKTLGLGKIQPAKLIRKFGFIPEFSLTLQKN